MKKPVEGQVAHCREFYYIITRVDPNGNKFWIKNEADEELLVIRRKNEWMAEDGRKIDIV